MGLKVMCWLNDREFKKRGHVSGDLCFSCLCIFPCTWYFLVETKTPPCISICKCIYGICRLDWYPSVLTHRLQVENWWKTRFRMLFFPWLKTTFFPRLYLLEIRHPLFLAFVPLKRKGILVYFAINTKSKMKHVFSFETTLYFCQNAFENFNSYLRNFFGGHQLRNQIWPYLPSTKVKL